MNHDALAEITYPAAGCAFILSFYCMERIERAVKNNDTLDKWFWRMQLFFCVIIVLLRMYRLMVESP